MSDTTSTKRRLGRVVALTSTAYFMVVLDSVVRLIPGALGCSDSAVNESFSTGLLDYPQYTRPAEFRGQTVPEVLLSGDHAKIDKWRKEQALEKTKRARPELIEKSAQN